MEVKDLASKILAEVGGKENVGGVTHCATRLRITVHNPDKVDLKALEKQKGVIKVIRAGQQIQVVIGDKVGKVYEAFTEISGPISKAPAKVEGNFLVRFFDLLSGSLTPLIPVFAGAGMIKALLILMVTAGVLTDKSGAYAVLSAAGNSVFYFFPIMLGYTISKKLGANELIGAAIGAALLEPSFTALVTNKSTETFFGIPIIPTDYASSLLPIFIAIYVYSKLEKLLRKYVPLSLQIFLVPMVCLGVMVPFTILVFGPFGMYVSAWVGNGINMAINLNTVIAGAIIGGLWIIIVSMGLHWAIIPIALQNLATNGHDQILAFANAAVFTSLGIALGVLLKTRNKEMRAYAAAGALGQFLAGIGEPVLYGITFRFKRVAVIAFVMSGITGAFMGLFDIKMVGFTAFTNIFTIVSFSPLPMVIITWFGSVVATAAVVYFFGYSDKELNEQADENFMEETKSESGASDAETELYSICKGTYVKLSDVDDQVFSSGTMGKGYAIEPTEGKIYAPFDGIVTTIYPTQHAIGLTSATGIEFLIHIGIDTFKLEGKGFHGKVEAGDIFRRGDLLMEFDIETIRKAGLHATVIGVVTNEDECPKLALHEYEGMVDQDNVLCTVG